MPAKILIVDDDPDFLFVLNRILTKDGHEVIQAEDGAEGLKIAESEKPDMVFLDVMMPDMNGWEVCKRLKAASPNLPVSMCSVLSEPEDIEKSIRFSGADDHLTKPLSFNKVLDAVSHFQSGPHIQEETIPILR
ncbi:response regulator [archaeon]|nr:response regulator [archaeon]